MNHDDLKRLFTSSQLIWIAERLRHRQERGQTLTGTLTLTDPQPEQREALDALLGRRPSQGNSLTLRIRALQEALNIANPGDIVQACYGNIIDHRARRAEQDRQWNQILSHARTTLKQDKHGLDWIDSIGDGLLKRLSKGDPVLGQELMTNALNIWVRMPFDQITLAELAAEVSGDTHALDRGQPLSPLLLRGLKFRTSHDGNRSAEARRLAWDRVGVVVDRLSAPALSFNLHAAPNTSLEIVLKTFRHERQPTYVTYQMLSRENPFRPIHSDMKEVIVVENPVVVDVAATKLGRNCAPLICTEGQPASAVKKLIRLISDAGARIHLHADFDWRGLLFVDQLLAIPGTSPWRMNPETYQSAKGTIELTNCPTLPAWSRPLADEMRKRGTAVYEEQILPLLLNDLNRNTSSRG